MSKKVKRNLRDSLAADTEQSAKDKDGGSNFGKQVIAISDLEDVKFYKVKEGVNTIDILPYIVGTDNHPKGKKKGDISYVLDYWEHRNIGAGNDSFLCLQRTFNQSCPICEEIKNMRKSEVDEEEIKQLYAKRRVLYNVKDVDGDEDIMLLNGSHYWWEKEIMEEFEDQKEGGEIIIFADPEDGASIQFRGKKESYKNNEFIQPKKFKFVPREEQYQEEIVEETIQLDTLLVIPTYQEVADCFFGVAGEIENDDNVDVVEEEENPREETKKKSKKSKKKSDNKCPHSHTFGEDCDEFDECDECDLWDECSDAFEGE